MRKRTAFGYLCLIYSGIEFVRSVLLWPADAKYLSGLVVKIGEATVPTEFLRWLVYSCISILGSTLAASSFANYISNIKHKLDMRRHRRNEKLRIVRQLFRHTDEEQMDWIEEFISKPKWSNKRPSGTLAEVVTEVLDRREGYPATQFLYRITPDVRFALRWRLWLRRLRLRIRHRKQLRGAILALTKEERIVLWMFWQASPTKGSMMPEILADAARSLQRNNIISIDRRAYSHQRWNAIALEKQAVGLVEKHVLGGRKVSRKQIDFG